MEPTLSVYFVKGIVRRTFSSANCVSGQTSYLYLISSISVTLLPPVWHPFLLSDIHCIENVQKRATRFIINDPTLGYKEC